MYIRNFMLVNSVLLSVSMIQYYFSEYIILTFLWRNYTLLYFITYTTKHKPFLHSSIPITSEFHWNVLTSTTIESMTHVFIKRYLKKDFRFSILIQPY